MSIRAGLIVVVIALGQACGVRSFVGEYLAACGSFVTRLRVDADGRYEWTHQCDPAYACREERSGRVQVEGADLSLDPPLPSLGCTSGPLDRLRPVRWGPRLYLVPPGALKRFCGESGELSRSQGDSEFLLRLGDNQKRPAASERPSACVTEEAKLRPWEAA